MAVAVGSVLKAVADITMPDSVLAQNVFHCSFTGTPTSQDEDDVVSDVVDWVDDIYTALAGSIDSSLSFGECRVYIYDSIDDDWDEIGSGTLTYSPSGSGDMLPHGVAGIARMKTIDPDVQGRKFFAGLTEATCVDSDLVASALTNIGAAALLWVTAQTGTATGGSIQPGVWSTVSKALVLALTDYIVNAQVGYQRRRKPGVGV